MKQDSFVVSQGYYPGHTSTIPQYLEANEYLLALKRADTIADEQERRELRDIPEEGRKVMEGNQRGARRWAKWRQERLKVTQQVRDVGLAEQTRSETGRRQVWQTYHKMVLWYRYGTSKDWQRAEKWLGAWRYGLDQSQSRNQSSKQSKAKSGFFGTLVFQSKAKSGGRKSKVFSKSARRRGGSRHAAAAAAFFFH